MKKALIVLSLVLGLIGPALAATTWDVEADFAQGNPENGAWAYGYGSGPSAFNLGIAHPGWCSAGLYVYRGTGWYGANHDIPLPAVVKNFTTENRYPWSAVTIYPGEVYLVAAPEAANNPMIRWTAPQTGTYSLDVLFQGTYSSLYNASVYVFQNTTLLSDVPTYSSPTYLRTSGSYSYANNSLALTQGDSLYFMADMGYNWFEVHDWTKIDATITLVPEPMSMMLLSLGGLGLLRRKS